MQKYSSLSFVVLCGCGTWSLAQREGYGLMILMNKMVRSIFASKRDELTEG
jgi:hypothetical protein